MCPGGDDPALPTNGPTSLTESACTNDVTDVHADPSREYASAHVSPVLVTFKYSGAAGAGIVTFANAVGDPPTNLAANTRVCVPSP